MSGRMKCNATLKLCFLLLITTEFFPERNDLIWLNASFFNTRKATVVFSSSRFPGTSYESYKEIFNSDATEDHSDQTTTKHKISEKLPDFDSKTLLNKLQFYSFKSKEQDQPENPGLGQVPGKKVLWRWCFCFPFHFFDHLNKKF